MKRKWLLCVLLCFSLLLCSCGIGDGGTQFTQIDSQYLESEKASQSEEPLQESMVDSEGKKLETQEVEASQEKSDFESETEKSTGDSTDVEKDAPKNKEISKKKKNATSASKTDVKKEKSKKAERDNSNSHSGDKSAKKKDKTQKQTDTSSKEDAKPADTPKPESTPANEKNYCMVSIDCHTILSNLSALKSEKKEFVPEDGWILKSTKVTLEDGDTAYDVLYKVCREYKIHMEAAYTPAYNTYYVEGICQLYEFDCGELSGWTYLVNGKSVNYGCSKYVVKSGDAIRWCFSCNAGRDIHE